MAVKHYDVFNGDADGLCALHQLRLAQPLEATLITGVKRDIQLLERVPVSPPAQLTVLDISLERNRDALLKLLEGGAKVLYFDHHQRGQSFSHRSLEAYIDESPTLCTSLLVNAYLQDRYAHWAVVAAFGDNLGAPARKLARQLGIPPESAERLKSLGELLNYNGYGESLADLHFHPATLYGALRPHSDPLEFIQTAGEYQILRRGFEEDMAQAQTVKHHSSSSAGMVFQLPPQAWARRVVGVFANKLAREAPRQAIALLVENGDGSILVSVRAPLEHPFGAAQLCARFPSGGGRTGAAGITALPPDQLNAFMDAFKEHFAS